MSEKMIIFDLDGTLWDSAKEVTESWNIVINDFKNKWSDLDQIHREFAEKIPVISVKEMKAAMGKTMDEIAESFMPDVDPELRKTVFRKCETFEVDYLTKTGAAVYDGVKETLRTLTGMGYKLAVVSNCQRDYVKAFIISMNMDQYFCDYEEWGRTMLSKGENIRLVMERNGCTDHAVYVGDTQKDCDASRAAGIPFIWAAYGFGKVEHPDAVINDIGGILDVVENLI